MTSDTSDHATRLARARHLLGALWTRMNSENIGLMAAGVAFYCFLSLVPLLAAVILTYGLIADPATVADHIRTIVKLVPRDAAKLILDQLVAVVTTSASKTGFGLIVALFFAFYGATRASTAIMAALNVIYRQEEDRSIVRSTLISFAIILGAVAAAVAGLFAATILAWVETIAAFLGPVAALLIQIGTWTVAALLASAAIGGAYRLGPAHPPAGWRWLSLGSGMATLLWLGATLGLGFYVSRFGNYNATYGSLSAVVVLLMWLWVSSYAILLGATINAVVTPPRRWRPEDRAPAAASPA
ncbi:YihY/virulence factor BrkB family protein [Sphingomonas morindae]|uniref:YihY/virulence factor BrkB family protein n=1 Tax=Sphingomonas morindae TaxID=1541170 RepID=A0ABY4XBT2_9SPHN|nr:YihY/virulence factor BrkB family protein [Sphingomonas morindae]USI74413.1 YihY/virulence factor BrkB family protein [Sphingomonas morindae]